MPSGERWLELKPLASGAPQWVRRWACSRAVRWSGRRSRVCQSRREPADLRSCASDQLLSRRRPQLRRHESPVELSSCCGPRNPTRLTRSVPPARPAAARRGRARALALADARLSLSSTNDRPRWIRNLSYITYTRRLVQSCSQLFEKYWKSSIIRILSLVNLVKRDLDSQ